MTTRTRITESQERSVIILYRQKQSIKNIMDITGVRSEQTIYRILRKNGERKHYKVKEVAVRRSIGFSADVWDKIKGAENISALVNSILRQHLKKK